MEPVLDLSLIGSVCQNPNVCCSLLHTSSAHWITLELSPRYSRNRTLTERAVRLWERTQKQRSHRRQRGRARHLWPPEATRIPSRRRSPSSLHRLTWDVPTECRRQLREADDALSSRRGQLPRGGSTVASSTPAAAGHTDPRYPAPTARRCSSVSSTAHAPGSSSGRSQLSGRTGRRRCIGPSESDPHSTPAVSSSALRRRCSRVRALVFVVGARGGGVDVTATVVSTWSSIVRAAASVARLAMRLCLPGI
ncbi:uncharacterized protein ISCGN_005552 [Ixodes scapularis]